MRRDMRAEPAIAVEMLSAHLGERPVLADVDLAVAAGEIVALLGHNGAGKSTLLRCIMGIIPHDTGTIRLAFANWRRDPQALRRAGVAYLPQHEKVFPGMTVEENLLLVAEALAMGNASFARQFDELARDFPVLSKARSVQAGRLSGGERQQVAVARTFLGEPKVMLLDEPSIGLAPPAREAIFRAIRAASNRWRAAVILVEHRMREALAIADRACILRRGGIVAAGDAAQFLASPERLRTAIT